MIKQLFHNAGIKVTDQELKEIMQITTDDIRENRMKFGKKTSMEQMFTIAKRSLKVLMSA
ncbi:hypothetical protein [Clostridium kluyveri]|uniref:Uncharacterized protein n=1 Tax=Clostridium kluyveri TaxID=1534 RepID=A0A1L5FC40_CLOKL|nr:hypothetical protein [Clostridium kluyveri]APM40574.1 hypothetical protein BS101_18530 [Clostridium kluyveri]